MSSSEITDEKLHEGAELHDSCENDDNGSLSFNNMSYSDSQLSHAYEKSLSVDNGASDSTESRNHNPPSASIDIYNRAQQQQMIENKVNMKVVETILSDALGGIEAGEVDLEMAKMYISSAITVIRSIS